MAELPKYKVNLLRTFVAVLLITGAIILIVGQNTPDAQIVSYEQKFFNKGWFYHDKYGETIQIPSLPAHIPSTNNYSCIFHELMPLEDGRTSLCFYSQHQNVTVKLNDEIIYTYKSSAVPKTLMSYRPVYNFVDLPPITSDSLLTIETVALVPSCAGEYNEVLLGDSTRVLFAVVREHISNFLLGVMFVVASIFLFGTNHLFTRARKNDHTLLYLSLLAFTIGLWQLDDSRMLLFFTGYLPLLWCLKYLTQLFMPIFTFLFLRSIVEKKESRFMEIIFWLILITIFLQFTLQMLGIKALTDTIFASHFIYVLVCTYTLATLFREEWLRKSHLKYLLLFSMISSVLIFAFTFFTLLNSRFFSSVMSFGLSAIFISMILIAYQKELKLFEAVNKADTYRNLAFIDIATGVNNKTAWYTLIENFDASSPQGEYCMIVFDMNNLKKLNDKFGHLTGDKVIKAFCDCLVSVVEDKGSIYRIGGDEFVCICYNMYREAIMTLLHRFDVAVENQPESEHKFTAAYGYEFFTPHSPADFSKALTRADEKMYEQKVAMKANRE